MNRKHLLFLLPGLLLLAMAFPSLPTIARRNQAALDAAHGLLGGNSTRLQSSRLAWEQLTAHTCRAYWYLGTIAHASAQPELRDDAWAQALDCSPENIFLVRSMQPGSETFARRAVQAHPTQADAWFWLAETLQTTDPLAAIRAYWQGLTFSPGSNAAWVNLGRLLATLPAEQSAAALAELDLAAIHTSDPATQAEMRFILGAAYREADLSQAISLYREGLALRPMDGIRWYELGDMLAQSDPQSALDAYVQACSFGDPGNHGCYNAGQIAEKQGKIEDAIRYYRTSDWPPALERANQLELQLP
jgi:tetratricopeptide (TPR) repeat protein